MKNIVILGALVLSVILLPISSFAGTSGCGVGTNIWKGEKGVVAHTSANTTNGIFSRPSSVTTGTTGCDGADSGTVKNEREIKIFLAMNLDNVAEEMSQGQGEYLGTYAGLLGCQKNSLGIFNQMTQEHYDIIFSNPDSPNSILSNTRSILKNNPDMTQACSYL